MNLQALINDKSPHSVLDLPPGEFSGQVTIDRALTIVGQKGTWIGSREAPAIRITARGVRLKNLIVEITSGADDVAIEADSGVNPVLENVIVRGRMVGVASEEVKSAVSLDEAPPVEVSSSPSPPVSPAAMNEEASELPQITLEFGPPRQAAAPTAPQSTRSRAKFVAAGVAVLLAVGFGSVLWLLYERDFRTTELKKADRLTALDKERIEREKREKEREVEKLKAQERERKRKEQDLPALAWNYPDEAKNMLRRAIQGDAAAQSNMGVRYEKGRGVPQDDAEAVKWYLKAAEQGHALGQSNLGWMYARGRGIARDDAEAINWIRKAAEQGNPRGQNNLGVMYERGQGIPRDDAEAVKWYLKAAQQGHALGQSNLGWMYARGRGIARDDAEAINWIRKAAEQGNLSGQNRLGYMYEHGRGVTQDHVEAVRWYRKAAELGNAVAQDNLGLAYSQGRGVPKDPQEAIRWFRKAAEQGHERAKEHLQKMGVPSP